MKQYRFLFTNNIKKNYVKYGTERGIKPPWIFSTEKGKIITACCAEIFIKKKEKLGNKEKNTNNNDTKKKIDNETENKKSLKEIILNIQPVLNIGSIYTQKANDKNIEKKNLKTTTTKYGKKINRKRNMNFFR